MRKSRCLQRCDEVTLMLSGSGGFAAVSLNKNDFFFHWALVSFTHLILDLFEACMYFYNPSIFSFLLSLCFISFVSL